MCCKKKYEEIADRNESIVHTVYILDIQDTFSYNVYNYEVYCVSL